jgi:hypothetical protein
MARALGVSGWQAETAEDGPRTSRGILPDGPSVWRFMHSSLSPLVDKADDATGGLPPLWSGSSSSAETDQSDGSFPLLPIEEPTPEIPETLCASGASGANMGIGPRSLGSNSIPAAHSASRASAAGAASNPVLAEKRILKPCEHPWRVFRPPRV